MILATKLSVLKVCDNLTVEDIKKFIKKIVSLILIVDIQKKKCK